MILKLKSTTRLCLNDIFSRSHSVLNKEWLGVYSKFLVTLIFFMSLLKTGLFFVSLRGFHWRVTSEGSERYQSVNLS